MADYRDHHATIFVAPEVAGPIEAARRNWDPDMAARIAAHVTVAYPREAPISDLLVERVREASKNIRAFRLRLSGVGCFQGPEGGVYVNIEDLDGGYRKMRDEVLRPPFHSIAYPPHVTLVHPQTSRRGREFWDSGSYQRQGQDFTVGEVTITAFDGAKWVVLMTYPLAGRPLRT
jgi:2'-5' RNA ligase